MNKKIFFYILGVLIIIVLAIVLLATPKDTIPPSLSQNEVVAPQNEKTIAAPPEDTQKQKEAELTYTTPIQELVADSKGTPFYIYNINLGAAGLDPFQLVLHKESMVQLNITNKTTKAIDVISSSLGLAIPSIQQNEVANINIDATKTGNFDIACGTLCPSGVKSLGKIVIQ